MAAKHKASRSGDSSQKMPNLYMRSDIVPCPTGAGDKSVTLRTGSTTSLNIFLHADPTAKFRAQPFLRT